MKTVILCGGKGTRMREETEYKPKPMVEIGGLPMLWHIMKTYSHHGFNDFILCLGYKGNMIKEYFLNMETFENDFTLHLGKGNHQITFHTPEKEDWNITFVDTGEETSTGGRIKKIEKYIKESDFFLTYGDGLSDVNIQNLYQYHINKNKLCTITGTRKQSRFGSLSIDDNGIAKSFAEKDIPDSLINGGFYVLNRRIFDYLTENTIFEEDILPHLASNNHLAVYQHHKYWTAIDTYKEVEEINKQWNLNNRPWVIWK